MFRRFPLTAIIRQLFLTVNYAGGLEQGYFMSETTREGSIPQTTLPLQQIPCTQGELLTGRDIHDAYTEVTSPPEVRERYAQIGIAFKFSPWEELSEIKRQSYERMAEVLNERVQGKPRTESEVCG